MNLRYVISNIDKDGFRTMTYAQQGRNTKATREEAERELIALLGNNSVERLEGVFGSQSTGTFEVSVIDCYPGHNDPKGCYIDEKLNPGQVCVVGKMKEIMEEVEGMKLNG